MAMVIELSDAVSGLVARLGEQCGVSVADVVSEAIHQLAGRDSVLVERVTASIARHRDILDQLVTT